MQTEAKKKKRIEYILLRNLLQAKIKSGAHPYIATGASVTYSMYMRDREILYSPKFFLLPTVGKNSELLNNHNRSVKYLEWVDDVLVHRFTELVELEEYDDLDVAIKKLLATGKIKSESLEGAVSTAPREDFEDFDGDGDEGESSPGPDLNMSAEDEEDAEIYDEIFTEAWNKEYSNLISRDNMSFDELMGLKGCCVIKIIGNLYLVLPIGSKKIYEQYSEQQGKIAEITWEKGHIINMLDSLIQVAKVRIGEGTDKISHEDIQDAVVFSCKNIFLEGKPLYDICTNSIKKQNCPTINSFSEQCDLEKILLDEFKKNRERVKEQ